MNITILLFILLLISLLQTSLARNPHICSPSSCGIIRNISFPFRLKHDPKKCGDHKYKLSCENNVTFLYLNSHKYQVKAINYDNLTISLVDASINNTNTCSFPKVSLYPYNFSYGYPYGFGGQYRPIPIKMLVYQEGVPEVALPINFMSCPHPLRNSSFLTDTNDCANGTRHTYIKVGHMDVSDLTGACTVDVIVMTSWKFEDLKNVSLSEIHDSLLYGFELSWSRFYCSRYKHPLYCSSGGFNEFLVPLTFVIMIVVVVFIGISIPAMIIIGFAGFFGILFTIGWKWSFNINPIAESLLFNIGFIFAVFRFIIGISGIVGLLIYKFRRRHLSMFNEIECFLRSDNKLMPIRYSYSDIKNMTRGFREKLGQGGYGTVYKGKLRSGYDVAVKQLGKAGGNGQDFMNEMATIGRIHHVNVVRLVGYCAERSKRVLVFDFMPNGSLDKYIYSREKKYFLSWERKYEIAVGVARGIEYLHRGCDIQILHFDIKPHNILLDDKFIPKITDFGLAKFHSTEKNTVTLTEARGTVGYVAPELINRGFGRVSYKADIYSFGMLLIEMVCLKKELTRNDENSSKYFPDWIYDCFDQGSDIEIGITGEENGEDDSDGSRKIARKMTIVALWCIQMSPDNRPSMNEVLEMLEGDVEHLQTPQRPTQSTKVVLDNDQSWSTSSTDSISFLPHDAAHSIEITVLEL